ncbi:MAG: winged helix DNA-binding domain-containing protein [Actinomycetota bacterium]|nr:winged helix DNA-binding domain-containing protein [Actinomycetota bacterium]
MAAAGIGLRRLAGQRIVASRRCEQPADVVRWLGALQAQDYYQSLWAIGSRLRSGTVEDVERAIGERRILRTWLMRGTIHFAPPEDVRWLLALCAPRLAVAEARRCEQLGLTAAQFARCAELLSAELSGDRRLTRPEVMRLFEDAGIETTGQRGYHILARLAREALICLGPMQGKQQTFVLLDDWAPRAESRDLSREAALALLASRFAGGRGPVTDQDFARWAGIPVTDARRGLGEADGLATRSFDGVDHWLAADAGQSPAPAAGRSRTYLLAGFDEYFLGYKHRDAVLAPEHAQKIAPGANGVFRPIIVAGGQIVGTWARAVRGTELTIALRPFAAAPKLAEQVRPEAARYRDFLGLPASADPILRVEAP